jgi:hypothetical protein
MKLDYPRYTSRPEIIRAVQFLGWPSFAKCLVFVSEVGATIYYVPRGYDHHLRNFNEEDGSTGHVLEEAADYLVLNGEVRIDRGDYLTFIEGGAFVTVFSAEEFAERFDQVPV